MERFPTHSTRPPPLITKPEIDTARKENYSPKQLISINAKKKKNKLKQTDTATYENTMTKRNLFMNEIDLISKSQSMQYILIM